MIAGVDNKKREEFLFFTAYTLWMTAGVLNLTMFRYFTVINVACDYAQKLAYLLLVCLFFTKKRDQLKDALGIILILLCCVLANQSVHNLYIIPMAVFIYFSSDFDFKKILKCTLIIQIVIMVISIFSSQVGLVEDVIWVQGDRARHSLGYDYCAYPAHLLLFMSLIWFCLRKKIHALEIVIVLALNFVIYIFTDSRTDLILAVVGILGFLIWQRDYKAKWFNRFRSFIVKFGFILAAAFSILAQALYNSENTVMASVNHVLNGRLRLGNEAIQTYGISLFGQNVRWFGQGSLRTDPTRVYNYVDNAFLKDGISFGILFLILLAAGFYLAGKILLEHKEYKLTWAMLVSLAYAVINAHLCMLAFNVFILLLGNCFQYTKLNQVKTREWISNHIQGKWKPVLRTGLILVILCAVTYAQIQGNSYMTNHARVYTWMFCGLLLLIAGLCWENDLGQVRITGNWYGKLIFVCLVIFCISDFFVDKKYQYAAFALLVFGGVFCKCWGSMEDPDRLIQEFKLAFKIWFLFGLIYCILCRPATHGICYSGMYPDAESFALSMMIAVIVFLSDLLKGRKGILNGIGALCALYLLWISKKTEIVLVACLILVAYSAFWLWQLIAAEKKEQLQRVENLFAILLLGGAFVYLIRWLLPNAASTLGTQIVYEKDKAEKIGVTLWQLSSLNGWKMLFESKIYNCLDYLKEMNLLGHNYLLEINEKKRWAANSIIMIAYRYGVIAGIGYLVTLIIALVQMIRSSFKKHEFLWAGIAIGCIVAGMLTTIEKPFVCLAWFVLWLGISERCICKSNGPIKSI